MNDEPNQREQLSALVDGETSASQMPAVLAYAESDEGQQSWRMYHLIGDVLRSPELAHHSRHDVLSGVRAGMAREPARPSAAQAVSRVSLSGRPAANAAVFRWKMAAGIASMTAAAAIGWSLMQDSSGRPPAMQLAAQASAVSGAHELPLGEQAQSSAVVAVAGPYGQSVMLRDPRLDELLASRSPYGSAANLQMPASFLRNANFASMGGARRP